MGEIMTVVLMRISDEFCKIQISPIVKISKKQYDMILGKDQSDEGKLVREIFTEKRLGIEQYGLIGYLTDGKFKTHNMYMEGLLDLINESRSNEEFRPNVLEYKNYRASKNAYLFSIKNFFLNSLLQGLYSNIGKSSAFSFKPHFFKSFPHCLYPFTLLFVSSKNVL